MNFTDICNPRATEDGIILSLRVPSGDVIDFHAMPTDVEEYGRELYSRAIGGEFGEVQPYAVVEPSQADLLSVIKAEAYSAIQLTDRVFIRCAKAGVAWPEAWQSYYLACLEIYRLEAWPVGGAAVPVRPEYPQGTG